MIELRFKVIFEGLIRDGSDPSEVRRRFKTRFKVGDDQLARFFSGEPTVLKRDLKELSARRLVAALAEVGADCRMVADSLGDIEATDTDQQDWPSDSPFATPCPEGSAASQPPLQLTQPHRRPWSIGAEQAAGALPGIDQETGPRATLKPQKRPRQKKKPQKGEADYRQKFSCLFIFLLLILAIVILGSSLWLRYVPVRQPEGVLISEVPLQTTMGDRGEIAYRGHTMKPLAAFRLRARVLARKQYRHDRAAAISPIDLALGWGRMSDSAVLRHIRINQAARFAFWRYRRPPIPKHEIDSSIANMHLIPGNDRVRHLLKKVRPGHLIQLEGCLVDVSAPDGFRWRSSLKRDDSGDGACEIIWVESFSIQ